MIEEIDEALDSGNNLSNMGSDHNSEKSQFLYTPPQTKEPLLANIISTIFHPLFMGIYGVALLFLYTDFNIIFSGQFIRFMLPVVFLTCVVPASSIYFLNKSGLVNNYDPTRKIDWFIPYLLAFCSYSLLLYYFVSANLYTWFIGILATPIVLIVIGAITTKYWKISMQMMAMGALIGCTLSVCYNVKGLNPFILFIILFILAGCLGVSRLILQRHTPTQVYISFLIGLIVSYICVWIGTFWAFIVFFFKNL
ncbi:hypothetical protein JGH11_07760 [Dysgonomonas sp. Marseille-P4677]|uniref:phosphatase PAP2 family protein n=1 Tax=Dysgonomonas sp. Marseille-P4677 TaxID=2364790 RepID=UPI00191390D4|nr:phosphatase PAP2 family protein [Dysgonomonas sp. Marseille-P4677]MBK5720766.1 hypothetical protein [Dysgonomonas sp. Marseille-P4677]